MNVIELINKYLPEKMRILFTYIGDKALEINEIRIRLNKPLSVKIGLNEYFVGCHGSLGLSLEPNKAYIPDILDIEGVTELISNYSLYAFENEVKNGYITILGGHRVGICGQAVMEGGNVKTLKNINGFNIRICHEILGASDEIIDFVSGKYFDRIQHHGKVGQAKLEHVSSQLVKQIHGLKNTLIISPPFCGKTTLLRDLVRQLSNGSFGRRGVNVSLVDERSEIAGSYGGICGLDVGIRTDVIDSCPKKNAMLMLLRSMSPSVIAVDEIGDMEDVQAIETAIKSGVKVICTSHGFSLEEVTKNRNLSKLIEQNVFDLFIVLKNGIKVGEIDGVFNNQFKRIY